jgi:hypothetical protein
MLFHREVGGLLSLVVVNIQLMSWGGWAHPVDREPYLIGLVLQDFLPGFSSRGEAPNEEFCEQGFRLSFRINDP